MLLFQSVAQEGLTQSQPEIRHVWQAESTAVTLTCICLSINLQQEKDAIYQIL